MHGSYMSFTQYISFQLSADDKTVDTICTFIKHKASYDFQDKSKCHYGQKKKTDKCA